MKELRVLFLLFGMMPMLFAAFTATEARRIYGAASVGFPPHGTLPDIAFQEVGDFVFVQIQRRKEGD